MAIRLTTAVTTGVELASPRIPGPSVPTGGLLMFTGENPGDSLPPPEGRTTESIPAAAAACPKWIGDYRIVRKIAEGGMGIVYEAEQQNPRRPVALKVILGGVYVDKHRIKLFQREAQTLAQRSQPVWTSSPASVMRSATPTSGGSPIGI